MVTWLPFIDNWQELVQQIKSNGMRPDMALKPGTPIEDVYPLVSIFPIYCSFKFSSFAIYLVFSL